MAKPYCAKWFEDLILHSVEGKAVRDKNARAYVKKLAKHAATAYQIGERDAIKGKVIAISDAPGTELFQAAKSLCDNAYKAGYEKGQKKRGETS